MNGMEYKIFKNRYLYLFISCLICGLLNVFTAWQKDFEYPNKILVLLGVAAVFVFYFRMYDKKHKLTERDLIFIIFAFGFIFRVTYIQATGHLIRQHDVGGDYGHLDYIERLFNGEGLPNMDVRKYWQYYQPPVWHIICANWLKFQTFIGISYNAALENLQLISLFFSSSLMFLSHKLFRMFKLEKTPLVIACALVAFHPTFIILSGSINNDVMSLALALLSCILAIQWYRDPKFSNIIPLAFTIGLSMAVKVSGGLISLAVAILFAIRLFGKSFAKKHILIGQFASFGIICIPLALWWQIRNLVSFGVPITYVPMLSEKSSQYIGFHSVFERIFDISSLWKAGVYPARVPRGYEFFEYNIPMGALKSSVFGEYYIGRGTALETVAKVLFWSAAVLAVLSVVAAIYIVVKAVINRKNENSGEIISLPELTFPLVCSATLIISYVKFCFDYAHFCTMDFRYIALTVVFGALYVGLLMKEQKKNNKIFGAVLNYLICFTTIIMSVSSVAIYGAIG